MCSHNFLQCLWYFWSYSFWQAFKRMVDHFGTSWLSKIFPFFLIKALCLRLARHLLSTDIFKLTHRCCIGFRFGLWLGHSNPCSFSEAIPLLIWRWDLGSCHTEMWMFFFFFFSKHGFLRLDGLQILDGLECFLLLKILYTSTIVDICPMVRATRTCQVFIQFFECCNRPLGSLTDRFSPDLPVCTYVTVVQYFLHSIELRLVF